MASAFTHAIAALAIGSSFLRPGPPARFWVLGAVSAAIPDLDAVGYWMGVPYDSPFGHRGFSHSIAFAALLATLCVWLAFRDERWRSYRARFWLFLFAAMVSHGVLDAMTNGGGGVAFFAPFDNERVFFPWRPLLVSPMSVRRFFTERGLRIIASEIVWVWIPAAVFALAAFGLRRQADPARPGR